MHAIIDNMPLADYHADGAISKSQLDDLDKSPAIFWARHRAKNRPPREAPTPAMMLGTLVHCAALEPAEFDARYAVAPVADRRTKEGKAVYEAFLAELEGREIITPDLKIQSMAMAAQLRTVPALAESFIDPKAYPETSAWWVDKDTGVQCRCRPDWIWPVGDGGTGVILVDVKTCPDASPDGFARSISTWRYHVQAAYYSDGFEAASGLKVHGFVFAAVEKSYPFAAGAYMLGEEDLEFGRKAYRRNLRTYAECLEKNDWPGYTRRDVTLISLPKWAQLKEASANDE